MGCAGCSGNSGDRCCLCQDTAKKMFPWGSKKKICWRCNDKQRELIIQRTFMNERAEALLQGKDWNRKKAEKEIRKK